jgi:hypothetical protein
MALVVEVVSAWLVDGVVDPTTHAWFASCRVACTAPVANKLSRAERRMGVVLNLAIDRLHGELVELIRPVAEVQCVDGRWECVFTDEDDPVDDEVEACIMTVARMISTIRAVAKCDRYLDKEKNCKLHIKRLLIQELFEMYRQLLSVPVPADATSWLVTAVTELFAEFLRNRARYYDPQWQPEELQ